MTYSRLPDKGRISTATGWVVILNYNRPLDTIGCLKSLGMDESISVVVVDNGSSAGNLEFIPAMFPKVSILKNEVNRGFSGGMNDGLRYAYSAGARYVCLLNNDARISAECLKRLFETLDIHPELAAVSPAIYRLDAPLQPWFLGSVLDERSGMAEHRNALPEAILTYQPWLSGCAMVIRELAIRTVGGFDERYFAYWEDVDWSVRVRAAGWKLALHRGTVAHHRVGSTLKPTSGDSIYYYTRNHLLFAQLNCRAGLQMLLKIAALHVKEGLRDIRTGSQHRSHRLLHTLAGIHDFHVGRFGPRPKSIGHNLKRDE